MLREALTATGIAPNTAASLLGVDSTLFNEWISEQKPLPHSFAALLSAVIGINLSDMANRKVRSQELAEVTPAIWYRFRGPQLIDEDREYVFLIRELGYFIHELETATRIKLVGWESVFDIVRDNVDRQAPPRVQGREAARIFREQRSLHKGATGIGDVIRGNLRSMGIVVVETPIPRSSIEGCCFFVGSQNSKRPCVFANSHHSTWFRRNLVLMHEVAHAIFDAEGSGAMLDFAADDSGTDIAEQRADSFAQEMLVPAEVLLHAAQQYGVRWQHLRAQDLAALVANIQVGQRTVLKAALAAGVITVEEHEQYLQLDIAELLRNMTDRALSAREYIRKIGDQDADWLNKRNTTVPNKRLRLPSGYVAKVIEAFQACQISRGKAAEMLMIDENTFDERFRDKYPELEEF